MSEPIEQQVELQAQANKLLEDLNLMKVLQQIGQPQIVGSVVLGLMTWPDIDIEVTTDSTFDTDTGMNLAQKFVEDKNIRRVTIQDYRDGRFANLPQGFYIGLECTSMKGVDWKIDIWMYEAQLGQAVQRTKEIGEQLTDSNRKVILEIKQMMALHPEYRKKITSDDIYRAVLDEGVVDLAGFNRYLQQTGRSLYL